jgi:predicted PurR-regulated permease PerM
MAGLSNGVNMNEGTRSDKVSTSETDKTETGFGGEGDEQTGRNRSIAITGLFILAFFYTLYFTRAFLLPIVLALLLTFLLRPAVRALKRVKIPEVASAALVLILLLGVVGYGTVRVSRPAAEWMYNAPESLRRIELKVSHLRKLFEEASQAAEELKKIATLGTQNAMEVEIKRPGFTDAVLTGTQEVLIKSSVMFILLYLLLASGDLFQRKFIRLFSDENKKRQVQAITREVERKISRYLLTVTIVNTLMGISLGIGMYLVGMPNPVLWGVMAGFLVFIPYLGPLIGVSIVTFVALLTFDSIERTLLVPAIYLSLETLQGQILTPMVLGFRLALNPVAIFIWLIFWGWIWGITGALLAVPMLTVFKIFCDSTKSLAPVGEFIGR